MPATKSVTRLTTFCQLRPYRHDLCPGMIKQASGDWACACDCGHTKADAPVKKTRRVVK